MKHFKDIVRAGTPEEAVGLRREAGARSLYLAGGTMSVPLAAKSVEVLVDISRLDLAGVVVRGGVVSIGATTRLADLLIPEVRDAAPLVWDAAVGCATPIVRNMATVGGWLVVAHLPSDLAVALLAAGATLDVLKDEKAAPVVVPIADLLSRGWLRPPDLVCGVTLRARQAGEGTSFRKFGRGAIDVALVNAAARVRAASDGTLAEVAVAVGQSATSPALLEDLAEEARGKRPTRALLAGLGRAAAGAVRAKSDFRASGEYRKQLIEIMVTRALTEAVGKAGLKIEA
ncbi:MAG: FAD binding domain-containing protein [bacterium]